MNAKSQTSASSPATTTAAPVYELPGGCAELVTLGQIDAALGTPLPGETRFTLGTAEPAIGRTGRVTCGFGVVPATEDAAASDLLEPRLVREQERAVTVARGLHELRLVVHELLAARREALLRLGQRHARGPAVGGDLEREEQRRQQVEAGEAVALRLAAHVREVGLEERVRELHAVHRRRHHLRRRGLGALGRGCRRDLGLGLHAGGLEHLALALAHLVAHRRLGHRSVWKLLQDPPMDAPRRMPLLARPPLILLQDPVDDRQQRIELGPYRRLAAPVPRRHREAQHLRHRLRVDAEQPRRPPLAHPLHMAGAPNPRMEIHSLHPPAPSARVGTKG